MFRGPAEGAGGFELSLHRPAPGLADLVEHYWTVRWDLRVLVYGLPQEALAVPRTLDVRLRVRGLGQGPPLVEKVGGGIGGECLVEVITEAAQGTTVEGISGAIEREHDAIGSGAHLTGELGEACADLVEENEPF